MAESESFLITFPGEWKVENHATKKRKFPSIQDFVRELVRRDMETMEKEEKQNNNNNNTQN